MPKTRPPYDPEFRQHILALLHSGRTLKSLAEEFGCTEQSIRNWQRQVGPAVSQESARAAYIGGDRPIATTDSVRSLHALPASAATGRSPLRTQSVVCARRLHRRQQADRYYGLSP